MGERVGERREVVGEWKGEAESCVGEEDEERKRERRSKPRVEIVD